MTSPSPTIGIVKTLLLGVINDFRQVLDLKLDLYPLVERAKQRWKSKNLNFVVSIEPGLIIHAPRAGFKQAVGHLIDNAAKFSPPNQEVKIFLRENGLGGCHLTIMNQGPSISKALHEKAFERFFQASQGDGRQNNGLGVGLTIARAFARALGGNVTILDSKRDCWVKMVIPPGKADWSQPHI